MGPAVQVSAPCAPGRGRELLGCPHLDVDVFGPDDDGLPTELLAVLPGQWIHDQSQLEILFLSKGARYVHDTGLMGADPDRHR